MARVCSEYVLHVLTEPLIDRKKREQLNRRLRPLPATKKWTEAEILRGKAVDVWKVNPHIRRFLWDLPWFLSSKRVQTPSKR